MVRRVTRRLLAMQELEGVSNAIERRLDRNFHPQALAVPYGPMGIPANFVTPILRKLRGSTFEINVWIKKVFLACLDRNIDIFDVKSFMDDITIIKSLLTNLRPNTSIGSIALQLAVIPDMVALEIIAEIELKIQLTFGKKYWNRLKLTIILVGNDRKDLDGVRNKKHSPSWV